MTDPLHIRITKARDAAGLKKAEVARRLEISPQAVNLWEHENPVKRRNPSHENLVAFAKLVGTTLDYLLGETDEMPEPKSSSIIRVDINSSKTVPLLPLDELMHLSSGKLEKKIVSKGETVPALYETDARLAAFRMSDASMVPSYYEDDIIYVNLISSARPEDDIAAFIKPLGITVFRNFIYDGPDHVLLRAENPAYRSYRFTLEEWSRDVDIIGVCEGHFSRKRRKRHTS